MAAISIGTLTDLEKSDYVREGLPFAKPELIYSQFAQKDRVAKREGKTRQWFRLTKPGLAVGTSDFSTTVYQYVKNATGAAPTWTPATPADTTVTATADYLFGQGHEWNEGVEYSSFADIPGELRNLNFQHAAEATDQEARDVFKAGTNVYYANGKASRGLLTSVDQIDMDDILDAVTVQRNYDAKPIRGMYRAMCSANTVRRLFADTAFREVVRYNKDYYFTGTIAELFGVGFQFTSKAPTLTSSGSNNAVSTVEQTIILSENATGITAWKMSDFDIVYTGPGGWGDEWAVRHALTWKHSMKAVRLNETWLIRVESAR
jgi:N4-gp56 family major capsid protein